MHAQHINLYSIGYPTNLFMLCAPKWEEAYALDRYHAPNPRLARSLVVERLQ
jgi:hypothetical protein